MFEELETKLGIGADIGSLGAVITKPAQLLDASDGLLAEFNHLVLGHVRP
jgi:hypothetical protein